MAKQITPLERKLGRVLLAWIKDRYGSRRRAALAAKMGPGTVANMAKGENLTIPNVDALLPALGHSWDELMGAVGSKAAGVTERALAREEENAALMKALRREQDQAADVDPELSARDRKDAEERRARQSAKVAAGKSGR